MAATAATTPVRSRCIYETCFVIRDSSPSSQADGQFTMAADPIEKAIRPILKKIGNNRQPAVAFSGSNSSLRTTYSAELDEINDASSSPSPPLDIRLNRSRSFQHHPLVISSRRGFTLHLSPKQRTSRMCNNEAVLSPISDKSETNGESCNAIISHHLTVPVGNNSPAPIPSSSSGTVSSRPRPALSLFKPASGLEAAGFNSSDSGISISAASSHEALLLPSTSSSTKPAHLSLNSSHGTIDFSFKLIFLLLDYSGYRLAWQSILLFDMGRHVNNNKKIQRKGPLFSNDAVVVGGNEKTRVSLRHIWHSYRNSRNYLMAELAVSRANGKSFAKRRILSSTTHVCHTTS